MVVRSFDQKGRFSPAFLFITNLKKIEKILSAAEPAHAEWLLFLNAVSDHNTAVFRVPANNTYMLFVFMTYVHAGFIHNPAVVVFLSKV
jgi:hypothetical protein